MRSSSDVLANVRAKIRLRHFALSTEDADCGWIARYYDFRLRWPGRLRIKDPKAAYSWPWFWVFPAPGHGRDPYTAASNPLDDLLASRLVSRPSGEPASA